MQPVLSVLTIPLMFLNFFGGIASGIWLTILGQWWAIGYGIAGLFSSSSLLSLAMMPGLIFAAPASMLAQKGKLILAFPLMLLGAVLSLYWLNSTAFLLTFGARLYGLTTLLSGLTIFTLFHLFVRPPILSIAIAICLIAAERRKPSPARVWS